METNKDLNSSTNKKIIVLTPEQISKLGIGAKLQCAIAEQLKQQNLNTQTPTEINPIKNNNTLAKPKSSAAKTSVSLTSEENLTPIVKKRLKDLLNKKLDQNYGSKEVRGNVQQTLNKRPVPSLIPKSNLIQAKAMLTSNLQASSSKIVQTINPLASQQMKQTNISQVIIKPSITKISTHKLQNKSNISIIQNPKINSASANSTKKPNITIFQNEKLQSNILANILEQKKSKSNVPGKIIIPSKKPELTNILQESKPAEKRCVQIKRLHKMGEIINTQVGNSSKSIEITPNKNRKSDSTQILIPKLSDSNIQTSSKVPVNQIILNKILKSGDLKQTIANQEKNVIQVDNLPIRKIIRKTLPICETKQMVKQNIPQQTAQPGISKNTINLSRLRCIKKPDIITHKPKMFTPITLLSKAKNVEKNANEKTAKQNLDLKKVESVSLVQKESKVKNNNENVKEKRSESLCFIQDKKADSEIVVNNILIKDDKINEENDMDRNKSLDVVLPSSSQSKDIHLEKNSNDLVIFEDSKTKRGVPSIILNTKHLKENPVESPHDLLEVSQSKPQKDDMDEVVLDKPAHNEKSKHEENLSSKSIFLETLMSEIKASQNQINLTSVIKEDSKTAISKRILSSKTLPAISTKINPETKTDNNTSSVNLSLENVRNENIDFSSDKKSKEEVLCTDSTEQLNKFSEDAKIKNTPSKLRLEENTSKCASIGNEENASEEADSPKLEKEISSVKDVASQDIDNDALEKVLLDKKKTQNLNNMDCQEKVFQFYSESESNKELLDLTDRVKTNSHNISVEVAQKAKDYGINDQKNQKREEITIKSNEGISKEIDLFNTSISSSIQKRKPGRPRKVKNDNLEASEKRVPSTKPTQIESNLPETSQFPKWKWMKTSALFENENSEVHVSSEQIVEVTVPKKRGRPRKKALPEINSLNVRDTKRKLENTSFDEDSSFIMTKRKRSLNPKYFDGMYRFGEAEDECDAMPRKRKLSEDLEYDSQLLKKIKVEEANNIDTPILEKKKRGRKKKQVFEGVIEINHAEDADKTCPIKDTGDQENEIRISTSYDTSNAVEPSNDKTNQNDSSGNGETPLIKMINEKKDDNMIDLNDEDKNKVDNEGNKKYDEETAGRITPIKLKLIHNASSEEGEDSQNMDSKFACGISSSTPIEKQNFDQPEKTSDILKLPVALSSTPEAKLVDHNSSSNDSNCLTGSGYPPINSVSAVPPLQYANHNKLIRKRGRPPKNRLNSSSVVLNNSIQQSTDLEIIPIIKNQGKEKKLPTVQDHPLGFLTITPVDSNENQNDLESIRTSPAFCMGSNEETKIVKKRGRKKKSVTNEESTSKIDETSLESSENFGVIRKEEMDTTGEITSKETTKNMTVVESVKKRRHKIFSESGENVDDDYSVKLKLVIKHVLEEIGKNAYKKMAEETKTMPPESGNVKLISCAICKEYMRSNEWSLHKIRYHNNIAWRTGEQPIDYSYVHQIMTIYWEMYKKKKNFYCDLCDDVKKSPYGYLAHRLQCGSPDKDIEMFKVICPLCPVRVLPFVYTEHERYHKRKQKAQMDLEKQQAELAERETEEGGKRKAAARATKLIQTFTKEEITPTDGIDRLYSNDQLEPEKFSGLLSRDLLMLGYVRCRYPNCNVQSTNHKEAKEHFASCNLATDQKIFCNVCGLVFQNVASVKAHIMQNHKIRMKVDDGDFDEKEAEIENFEVELVDRKEEYKMLEDPPVVNTDVKKKVRKMPVDNINEHWRTYTFSFLQTIPNSVDELAPQFNSLPYQWNMEFCEMNYTKPFGLRFLFKTTAWKKVDPYEILNFLPKLKISMPIAVKRRGKSNSILDFKRFKLFESQLYKNDSLISFCGGPISALAWVPTPFTIVDCDQILAVGVRPDINQTHFRSKEYHYGNIIQFWNYGKLKNSDPSNDVKLEFCLAHNLGAVVYLEWCPSGCYEPDGKWIGLLAVASTNRDVHGYAIPHANQIEGNFFKPIPVFKLTFQDGIHHNVGGIDFYVTKISWTKASGHEYIAVGYSNGAVAIFKLSASSELLRKDQDETTVIYPYLKFYAHSFIITGLSLYHLNCGNKWLATSSVDGFIKLWDLENVNKPSYAIKQVHVKSLIWLSNLLNTIESHEYIKNFTGNLVTSSYIRDFASQNTASLLFAGSNVDAIGASDWCNIVIQGTGAGEIIASNVKEFFTFSPELKLKRLFLGTLDVITLKENDNSNSNVALEYEEAANGKGLVFTDYSMENYANFRKMSEPLTNSKQIYKSTIFNRYPLDAITTIAVNPNRTSYMHVAVGLQVGFVKLMHMKFMLNNCD